MSEDRRTKAELKAAIEATALEAELNAAKVEAERLQQRLDRQTPEARAIDMCVTALDSFQKALSESKRNTLSMGSSSYSTCGPPMLHGPAGPSVETVLSYLARRYGVADPQAELERLQRENVDLWNQTEQLKQRLREFTDLASRGIS